MSKSLTALKSCAKSFIALVFMSCSFLASALAGEYDDALDEISAKLTTLNNYLSSIDDSAGDLSGSLFQQAFVDDIPSSVGSHNWQRYLSSIPYILGGVDGLSSTERTKANTALKSIGRSQQWITTNNLPYYMSQILQSLNRSSDILASNPWWATNSEFSINWSMWDSTAPKPTSRISSSFPELMSVLASTLLVDEDTFVEGRDFYANIGFAKRDWSKTFGLLDSSTHRNYSEGAYSFYDYVADAFKSNWTLAVAYSTNELIQESVSSGAETAVYDTTSNVSTSAPPDFAISKPSIADMSDILDSADSVGDFFPDVANGDSRLVLFSGGRYGDVTVDRVYVDLSLDDATTQLFKRVSTWLWRLLLFVGLLGIARTEYDYWITLGGSVSA